MRNLIIIGLFIFFLSVCGCAYRHYLGFHGPTIKNFPEIHENIQSDVNCLECHPPGNDPDGPATSHPEFKGCLKCHND